MLTPTAKKLLAETIRGTAQDPDKGLRARLLSGIHDEAERRYRLALPIGEAKLDEAHRRRRERLEAWLEERVRVAHPSASKTASAKEMSVKEKAERLATWRRFLAQAEKEAAATFLNRLVLLRHLEELGLSKPAVVKGGWNSKGYREFRAFAPTLCTNGTTDATEGYATLLELVFDELALDLPGLFGDVGLTRLFPIPASTLREIVERLDDKGLESAWADDTTLGWVYQYWNDPDREAKDAKISAGGKIEPHEIASKTQMFTERYMVEWLLQNSLGLTWLAMCKKHGWPADAERILPILEERRAAWRSDREAGRVAQDALMPTSGELEEHWKYYVPQPLPSEAVASAPETVAAIKLLDPACGSGHFLVIAFDLLAALYREEARHTGRAISDQAIAESILENNLHGIDIDPRAIQIAAAGLTLKARAFSKAARPRTMNLVAPVLELGSLPPSDPAVAALKSELKAEVGLPEALTEKLLQGLAGVDYLGSLLKVDAAIEEAMRAAELGFEREHGQGDLFEGFAIQKVKLTPNQAKASVLGKLEAFLAKHSTSDDLGLRLGGEALAAGVRFVRMAKEGRYDLVVGNPPYQGLSKTAGFGYVATHYPRGKADLYAAFLERSLEFARPGGISALLTMRGWMFLGQFAELRKDLLKRAHLHGLADLDSGAFEDVTGEVLSTVMSVFSRIDSDGLSYAVQPTASDDKARSGRTARKRAALLAQVGSTSFDPRGFDVIEGAPLVYWWTPEFLAKYASAPKLGDSHTVRYGLSTQNNTRWLRAPWEVRKAETMLTTFAEASEWDGHPWVTYIKGSEGKTWCDEIKDVILWRHKGLELATYPGNRFGRGTTWYFQRGIAFVNIGSSFSARAHSRPSIFGHVAGSVFSEDAAGMVCLLNSRHTRRVMESLNPGIHFLTTDVERLPLLIIDGAAAIFSQVEAAFTEHEAHREASVEFRRPGPTDWTYAQDWAQRAVDRPEGAPLPAYEPVFEEASPEAQVSFAIGVALGRFGANGEGILDEAPASALPSGLLFVSAEGEGGLSHPAAKAVEAAWAEHGKSVSPGDDLGTYLRKSFFDFHKKTYENRPIYFPLSSSKKSFVVFASIHRWSESTLSVVLADHLLPTKRRLDGELDDLRSAKASPEKSASGAAHKSRAEKRFTEVQKLLEELGEFIAKVTEIAEKGPPPLDDKTPKREVDARYVMDLDDGVMVSSAGLWPLLEPQWKDPEKWWKELALAFGKKDYDWSHLAGRYFPTRVRKKCHEDPSLAVAHGCFWELHPDKAYAWELRLDDEIGPPEGQMSFTIDEPGSDEARAKFLAERSELAAEIRAKEQKRREKKLAKDGSVEAEPLFEEREGEDGDD